VLSFWCSATELPWSWAPRLYPGIWLAMGLLIGLYVRSWRRHRRSKGIAAHDARRPWFFGVGVALLWIATDWPVGALGAGYLSSIHMLQFLVYTLGAAPLIMLGTPDWMVRPLVLRLGVFGAVRRLARPLVAGIAYNLLLISTHAPFTVDLLRTNQLGSMVLDVAWLVCGFILWLPILSPLRELRHPSPPAQCIYLFITTAVVAMVPGAILTFSSFPLYSAYEIAPRVGDIASIEDQQAAGVLMKVATMLLTWVVIFAIFIRWATREQGESGPRRIGSHPPVESTASSDAPSP
jgi:putative membrane protein